MARTAPAPRQRLVHVRIAEDVLLIEAARNMRVKREMLTGSPMNPGATERAASERISYWERYLLRCGGVAA